MSRKLLTTIRYSIAFFIVAPKPTAFQYSNTGPKVPRDTRLAAAERLRRVLRNNGWSTVGQTGWVSVIPEYDRDEMSI